MLKLSRSFFKESFSIGYCFFATYKIKSSANHRFTELYTSTRSGNQESNPYKTPIKYNTLIINTKILGHIVEYCK